MSKRSIFIIFALSAAMLLGLNQAHAEDKGSQFGVMYGLSVPDADNTNMFRMFGIHGEAFITPVFSAGGYYLQSDKSGQVNNQRFQYALAGVEAMYHIPAAQGDTFVGFRMGMTKLQESPGGTDATFSPYHYGFATGYDYYMWSFFSVGFEGSYLHVLPGRTTVGTVTYEQPSFNLINFLVKLQFRL